MFPNGDYKMFDGVKVKAVKIHFITPSGKKKEKREKRDIDCF